KRVSCALPCRLGAGVGVRLRQDGGDVSRTAARRGGDVFVCVRVGCGADEQCGGACLASWGAVAENEAWSQEPGGFGILGVYLVGGGDTPTARSRCVGFSDGLYGRSRRRARPAIVVNHVEYRSCRLTGEWSMNDYSRTMGPKPAMKRTLTFATPAMTSPLVE